MITAETAETITDLVHPVMHNDETSATIALTSLMADPMSMGQTFVSLVELAALCARATTGPLPSREAVAAWIDAAITGPVPST